MGGTDRVEVKEETGVVASANALQKTMKEQLELFIKQTEDHLAKMNKVAFEANQ